MRYVNTKTGAIVDSPCLISGGDWADMEEFEVDSFIEDEDNEEQFETDEEFDEITVKQIKQELDNLGIEHNPKGKKRELYDLMIQGR